MTISRILRWFLVLFVFLALVTAFWWQLFHPSPSLREMGGATGVNAHVYGESAAGDAATLQALVEDAHRGNPAAQAMLGAILESHGNKEEAIRWYRLAAAQGYEDAQARLEQLGGATP